MAREGGLVSYGVELGETFRARPSTSKAMEKRLNATLAAVQTVQPALTKFYNSLSDEQKARFNSLRSVSRPTG